MRMLCVLRPPFAFEHFVEYAFDLTVHVSLQ
jgi:hypothetical protein